MKDRSATAANSYGDALEEGHLVIDASPRYHGWRL